MECIQCYSNRGTDQQETTSLPIIQRYLNAISVTKHV